MKKEIMRRIKEYLDYNPKTGYLVWKKSPNKKKKVGDIAGYTPENQYARIRIKSEVFFSHRIAWYLYYGEYPQDYVRHLDGDRSNNKIENLYIGKKEPKKKKVKPLDIPPGIEYVENIKKYRVYYYKNHEKKIVGYYMTKSSAIRAQKQSQLKREQEQ